MLHIFIRTIFRIIIFSFSLIWISNTSYAENANLHLPLKDLFSHKNHLESFKKTGISCTNCHSFSLKSNPSDPLAPGVPKGLIKPSPKICHECHHGKVQLPRPSQCTLCHISPKLLEPKNHKMNWSKRHGLFAQSDSDSCLQCHSQNNCTECHQQKNKLKPKVHKANFRSFHSIEARSNPQSCVACHSTSNTCTNCHTRGFK
ncbi:MAG TPA: cytochrome c3 family protein [Pseudobdellovibrionaceae bacterium]|nr:cytochrome c3 family protein [Pseudobdellovibrionaceae bacterium]